MELSRLAAVPLVYKNEDLGTVDHRVFGIDCGLELLQQGRHDLGSISVQ
jgi:hypothetical protein